MKKLASLALFLILLTTSSYGQFKFGAGIAVDIDDSFFGIQGRGHYTVNEEFAGQATFSYFFEDFTLWTIDLDVHYSGFEIGDLEGFSITPFAGLNVYTISVDVGIGSSSDTEMGINLGVNATIPITDSLDLYIEPKVVLSGIDGIVLAGGVYF